MRRFFGGRVLTLFFLAGCVSSSLLGQPETVDRVVAVVNERVITLTDIRVVRAFGLHQPQTRGQQEVSPSSVLKQLIDQKLVIQLSGGEVKAEKEEVNTFLKRVRNQMGEEQVKKKLEEFGFTLDDLKEYIREKILFQKLISEKFGRSVVVNLDEIEDYYREIYIPSQKEKGLQPQPMIEILQEIESRIQEKKVERQVEEWIDNLKNQAEIQIKVENLDDYFKQGSEHG